MKHKPELDGEIEFNISLPLAILTAIGIFIANFIVSPAKKLWHAIIEDERG